MGTEPVEGCSDIGIEVTAFDHDKPLGCERKGHVCDGDVVGSATTIKRDVPPKRHVSVPSPRGRVHPTMRHC